MKNSFHMLSLITIVFMTMMTFPKPTYAAITTTGNIYPTPPDTWTSSGVCGMVGNTSDGTMSITDGSVVSSNDGIIGHTSEATGEVFVDGSGSKWITGSILWVGRYGTGTLNITSSGSVSGADCFIGDNSGAAGEVSVDGLGSALTSSEDIFVGRSGNGTLNITNGGMVNSYRAYIGEFPQSTCIARVDGIGSIWANSSSFYVGRSGSGSLNIANGGLVKIGGTFTIDRNENGDNFVNMSTGGMLALYDIGWTSNDELDDFLALIEGTDAINYWNGSAWVNITSATYGIDYTLEHLSVGDMAGYTVLTVPEPATLALLALGGLALRKRK